MALSLPTVRPSKPINVTVEPLTPEVFAPFGTAVTSPTHPSLKTIPASIPKPLYAKHQNHPQYANQNTALKTSSISPLSNNYPPVDQANDRGPSTGAMSLFSCFPRHNLFYDEKGKLKLKVSILERHPFTTQTFCPFNFSDSTNEGPTYFLVVVAPTLQDKDSTPINPPDLNKIRAFLVPTTIDGAQSLAVTYGPGTWHAPMVVIGSRRIDFLVTQFVNGNAQDDCQETLIGTGFETSNAGGTDVMVDLSNVDIVYENSASKAKL